MRKRFRRDGISLQEIVAATTQRELGLMARETQDTYFNKLKKA
jgi:hypothetical protein